MTLRKDAMEILRVFNNNVVLAKGGDGGEVILTGRGLGFQAKPGQTVDESKVVRTFVPSDGRDPDHLAQMLADIPPEIIRVVVESMQEAGLGERESRQHHAGHGLVGSRGECGGAGAARHSTLPTRCSAR